MIYSRFWNEKTATKQITIKQNWSENEYWLLLCTQLSCTKKRSSFTYRSALLHRIRVYALSTQDQSVRPRRYFQGSVLDQFNFYFCVRILRCVGFTLASLWAEIKRALFPGFQVYHPLSHCYNVSELGDSEIWEISSHGWGC